MTLPKLLIVDDEPHVLDSLSLALSSEYDVIAARTAGAALASLTPPPEAAIVDLRLSEAADDRSGLDLIKRLRETLHDLPVVILTGYADVSTAGEAMRSGASDFIEKGSVHGPELSFRIAQAIERARLRRRVSELERDLRAIEPGVLVGDSARISEVRRQAQAAAEDSQVTVLIRGETGTGKELIARMVHAKGPRASMPFVAVNLSSLPASMLESELFGFEPGAFTDARRRHIGYFERAHRGVLFLDEISEIPVDSQAKLLRFLEEREIHRLGGNNPIKLDVQVVGATNARLEDLVRAGRFKEDLYFRLKVYEIVIPPLRDRAEDIPQLINYFLEHLKRQGKSITTLGDGVMRALQWYVWPGNVREVKNALESAALRALMNRHRAIELTDLPTQIHERHQTLPQVRRPGDPDFSADRELAERELELIRQALSITGGRNALVWKVMGYPNRHWLKRRVQRAVRKFPELSITFSDLARRFEDPSQPGALRTN